MKELVRKQQQGTRISLKKRTGREYLIVCPWDYASYLNVSFHVSHHDRGGIHPIIPVMTNGERGCYCALGYCWDPKSPRGSQTTLLTTMIDQFRQSLPVKELPIPIKEAIEVTRNRRALPLS
jgi:hypothetical protein